MLYQRCGACDAALRHCQLDARTRSVRHDRWTHMYAVREVIELDRNLQKGAKGGHGLPCNHSASHRGRKQRIIAEIAPDVEHQPASFATCGRHPVPVQSKAGLDGTPALHAA